MSKGIFRENAQDYWDQGIVAVPVRPGTKQPSIPRWSSYITNMPNQERRQEWLLKQEDDGIGVLMYSALSTGERLGAIDVDDDRLVEAVRGVLGSPITGKRGAKGMTFFIRMPATDSPKSTTLKGKNGLGNIDVLAKGRFTVTPPTLHPETNRPYEWEGVPLLACPHEQLPLCDSRVLGVLRATVESEHAMALVEGRQTHEAGLSLTASLVRVQATDDEIRAAILNLLPADYTGNTPEELAGWIESAKTKGFDRLDDDTPPRDELVARLVEEEFGLMAFVEGDGFLQYGEGHWKSLPDNQIDQVSKRHVLGGGGRQYASSLLRPIRTCLSLNVLRTSFGQHSGLICCDNGTLDVRTGELLEHSPDHELRYRLGITYDPEAKCPRYDQLISSTLMGDEKCIALVDEFAALTLIPHMGFQVALYLVGEGGSGKSSILRVVEMVHDPNAVSTTPLDKVDDERHRTDIANKLVCISYDVQTQKRVFGETFTRITGEDSITTRRLYHEVDGRVQPSVRFIGSMNPDMPGFIAAPDALQRRLLLVPCGTRVDNPDPDLFDKLKAEKAGILARYVRALKRLLERKRFDIPECVRDEVREYVSYQDAFDAYAAERLRRSQGTTPVAEIALDFNDWADQHGEKHLSTFAVGRKLKRLGYTGGQERRDRGQGSTNTRVVNAEITVPRRSWTGPGF